MNDLFNMDINSLGEDTAEMIDVNVETEDGGHVEPKAVETQAESTGETDTQPEVSKETTVEEELNTLEVDAIQEGDIRNNTPQEQKPKEGGNDTSAQTDAPFTPFAKAFVQEGILPNLDVEEFDGTAASLLKAFQEQRKVDADAYKDGLPDKVKQIIENYEEGVPLDQLIESKSRQIVYGNITESQIKENANIQKSLVHNLYASKGFKPEKIADIIKTLEDTGKLEQEGLDSHAELREYEVQQEQQMIEENKTRQAEFEKRNKEQIEDIKGKVNATKEIIPGMELNETLQNKIFESMTQVTGNDANGNPSNRIIDIRQEDPLKFDMTLHYLAELGVFNGDWSKIKASTKTNVVKELESTIGKGGDVHFSSSKPKRVDGEITQEDILSSLKVFQ